MKKEKIYIEINNEAEQKRAIHILLRAGEKLDDVSIRFGYPFLFFTSGKWHKEGTKPLNCTYITIDQLEQLLTPSIDKEIEDFKKRMKERGFEISIVIEKEVIKPDDVVMFWDNGEHGKRRFSRYKDIVPTWQNIVKVTDEHVLKFLGL